MSRLSKVRELIKKAGDRKWQNGRSNESKQQYWDLEKDLENQYNTARALQWKRDVEPEYQELRKANNPYHSQGWNRFQQLAPQYDDVYNQLNKVDFNTLQRVKKEVDDGLWDK